MLDMTDNSIADFETDIRKAVAAIETIILGKSTQIELAVCCLIARGHCLIEDLPGVGKTTLSQTIAQVFGLNFNRIQFTSDLLPGDILGSGTVGTGCGLEQDRFLQPGDRVRLEIEGLGVLENEVFHEKPEAS